jgi:hypothetical protein
LYFDRSSSRRIHNNNNYLITLIKIYTSPAVTL